MSPYSIYPELDFDIPTGTGEMGQQGDCFDRYMTRIRELKECCKIVRQCLAMIPDGRCWPESRASSSRRPAMSIYGSKAREATWAGMWVSDGTEFPYRTKIRTGSFSAMSIVDKVSQGLMIADLIALIASFDVVAPEVDR